MGRGIPFGEAASHGHNQPGFRRRRFEIRRAPGAERLGHRSAIMRNIPKQAQHAIAVMREICMQTNPAPIAAAIKPGNRIPPRAGGLARDAQPMFGTKLNRGIGHCNRNALRATAAPAMDFRRRKPCGRYASLRRRIHAEAGRLHRFGASQAGMRQRCGIKCGLAPKRGEDIGRGRVHGGSFHPRRIPVQPRGCRAARWGRNLNQ